MPGALYTSSQSSQLPLDIGITYSCKLNKNMRDRLRKLRLRKVEQLHKNRQSSNSNSNPGQFDSKLHPCNY